MITYAQNVPRQATFCKAERWRLSWRGLPHGHKNSRPLGNREQTTANSNHNLSLGFVKSPPGRVVGHFDSSKATTSSSAQTWSVTPAAIAGVILTVLWTLQKL